MSAGRPVVSLLALFLVFPLMAQQRPGTSRIPIDMPPGWPQQRADAGLPWPDGLGRKEALTGHIAAMDKDQIMVRSLDYGEVLFWVDAGTVVRVEKTALALSDLKVRDPVAVRLKNIKGKGPYATEILPHPDVLARKQRGASAAPSEASAGHGTFMPPDTAAPPLPGLSSAPAMPGETADDFPRLPRGANGVVGTVAVVAAEALELRDTKNQVQKVLVTGVTQIKRAGSETVLPSVKAGDRVAVTGDRLDSGEWIAREILVSRASGAAAPSPSQQSKPAETEVVAPDGLARFSGTIAALGNEEIRVRTARGERVVLITGGTEVRRMGTRGNFASLKQEDEVNIVGDVLQDGVVVAREVTVTKLSGSY